MNLAASAWSPNSPEWFEKPHRSEGVVRPSWPLELVHLTALMDISAGRPAIAVGLIDGPVWMLHPDLARENIRPVSDAAVSACSLATSMACSHGTYVAGILAARRGSAAPALCPGCTLLVRGRYEHSIDQRRPAGGVSGRNTAPAAANMAATRLMHDGRLAVIGRRRPTDAPNLRIWL